jgi:hypothetical protein
MKVSIKLGVFCITPETLEEHARLVHFVSTEYKGSKTYANGRAKHRYPTKCEKCGKVCVGKRGRSMHMTLAHKTV